MNEQVIANAIFVPEVGRLLKEGHTVTFRVKGYSMRPFLEDCRDKVILNAPDPNKLKPGDVILAEVAPKRYVLHRLIAIDGEQLTLRGDGNVCGVEHCTRTDVIGIALGFYRKRNAQPDMVSEMKWRFYSFVWMKMNPSRRYLLAFHRRIWLRLFPVKTIE